MKYLSFRAQHGVPTWGVAEDGLVYDLGPTGQNLTGGLREAVTSGLFGDLPDSFREAPTDQERDIRYLPPITDPGKIICIGVNYRAHQEEASRTVAQAPTVFSRFADTQMGHLEPAQMPASTEQFDYEGELALVIGRDAFHVSEDEAFDHVAGYAAYNDFSVRDWQRKASQWTPGKNFPGTGGFGPYLVPASDVGDVAALTLETRVNDEVRQHASVADLTFSIPQLIAYVTAFTPLSPGDVVVTGTPGGVGLFMDPPRLLSEGDVVEVDITGLGVLRNTVTRVP